MGNTFTNIAATTAAVANRFVASTNMKVGTYTVANASPVWQGGCFVTITHATVATGTDTLGTVTIAGTDPSGQTISEVITPLADAVATSTKVFRTVTSVTGAGWVIAGGNDTIQVGCAAGAIPIAGPGTLDSILINTAAAATIVISDAYRTIATLPASVAAGTYFKFGVDVKDLKVATTSTNDITVIHTASLPQTFAL
jgi:hypothetical protein